MGVAPGEAHRRVGDVWWLTPAVLGEVGRPLGVDLHSLAEGDDGEWAEGVVRAVVWRDAGVGDVGGATGAGAELGGCN